MSIALGKASAQSLPADAERCWYWLVPLHMISHTSQWRQLQIFHLIACLMCLLTHLMNYPFKLVFTCTISIFWSLKHLLYSKLNRCTLLSLTGTSSFSVSQLLWENLAQSCVMKVIFHKNQTKLEQSVSLPTIITYPDKWGGQLLVQRLMDAWGPHLLYLFPPPQFVFQYTCFYLKPTSI